MQIVKRVFVNARLGLILGLLASLSAFAAEECSNKLERFLTAVSQPADPLSLAPYGRVAVVSSSAFAVLQSRQGTSLCQSPRLWQSFKQYAFTVSILAEPGEIITPPLADIHVLAMTKQDQQNALTLDKAINQQPILAIGASDNDVALLEYTSLSTPSLVIVLKTQAYPQIKLMQKAASRGWLIF